MRRTRAVRMYLSQPGNGSDPSVATEGHNKVNEQIYLRLKLKEDYETKCVSNQDVNTLLKSQCERVFGYYLRAPVERWIAFTAKSMLRKRLMNEYE